jgi:hypothetical protein
MKGMEGIPTEPGGSRLFGLDSRRAGLVAAHAHVPGLPSWNLVRPWRTSPLPGAYPKSQRPTTPAQSASLLHPLQSGRPGQFSCLGPPQIRTCGTTASGSSYHGFTSF